MPSVRSVSNRTVRAAALLVALTMSAVAPPAAAQQSRIEERAKLQAEKAKKLKPPAKNRGERAAGIAERYLAGNPQGIYPWFGSVTGGGWLAVGAGYQRKYADTGLFDVHGGWSIKNYKLIRSTLKLPELAGRRLAFQLDGSWMDAGQVKFYGVGNDSRRAEGASSLYRPARVGATGAFAPVPWIAVGGGVAVEHDETGPGRAGVSIEDVYAPAEAPGLGVSPTYTVRRAFAAVDWRDSPGYSRRGGLYRIEWSTWAQHDRDALSFERVEVEVVQLVPLLRENWVIALHGLASMSSADAGREVPYFMMAYLGSSRTLRGYSNRRFRDRNVLLMNAEYRWTPSHFLDMALFFDAGKVGPRREDLNFDGLKTSYGFGLRFHSPNMTVLRWDFAWSKEGFHWIFASSAAF